jgi:cytosine/adenosine deaminase-related metal-dependent hydrolase
MHKWDLKTQFLEAVKAKGGFVSCHAHFDKAFYITKEELDKSMVDMEQKWLMSDDIKKKSTQEEVEERIKTGLNIMMNQGVKLCASFIDAYDAVGHKNIDAAIKVKEEYKDKIDFMTLTQPLGGLIDKDARNLFEKITAKADIAGGLPSRDRPNDDENYDHLFSIAKNLDKNVHVHIDQENNPNEKDTEKLLYYVEKHGYQGKVTAVHVLSVSAQEKSYRKEIYKRMADNGVSVVVTPGAALGMRQLDQFQAPLHNSIANVPEMLEAGLTVGLGVDNVFDFYHPFLDGDLWIETRMLMEGCRYYDFDKLVEIASINGRKILESIN